MQNRENLDLPGKGKKKRQIIGVGKWATVHRAILRNNNNVNGLQMCVGRWRRKNYKFMIHLHTLSVVTTSITRLYIKCKILDVIFISFLEDARHCLLDLSVN